MAMLIKHKERTRARILDEAAKAMLAHGAADMGVAAVMKRAGLTHGGFYAHFSSRDDLVGHTIERLFADSETMMAHRLAGKAPAQGLREMIDGYLSDEACMTPDFACPIPAISAEARRLPERARQRLVAGIRYVERIMAELLRNLGRINPDALAVSVFAEMIGAMTLARAHVEEGEASSMLAHARARAKERLGV